MKDYSEYLLHYGIPGMKWGQSKYKNKDGTFNDAGKVRYHPNGKKMYPYNMSNNDLINATNRYTLERNYYNAKGDYYKTNDGSKRNVSTKATSTAAYTFIGTMGAATIKNIVDVNRDKSISAENKAEEIMRRGKNALKISALAAVVMGVRSATKSVGGDTSYADKQMSGK